MANGTYLRGEVYWVCLDDSIGGEEKTGRPGVVVSADGVNEKNDSVTIAFTTKQGFATPHRPSIVDPYGGKTRVLCDQLRTVDKSRLTRYLFTVDVSELTRITGALASALCISYKPEKKDTEANEVESLEMQVTMYQKLYEKTMDQLVEMKMANDLNRKMSEPKKEAPAEDKPLAHAPTPAPGPENTRAEINSCSVEDLMNCGCSVALARLIISYRPYKSVGDLTRVPGLKSTAFQILKHKVCCKQSEETTKPVMIVDTPKIEVKTGKVNVNTAKVTEIKEALGCALNAAYAITGHRKRNGRFTSLEEIATLPYWSETMLAKYRDKLEV